MFSDDPELILPHPFAHQRAFVLIPWLAVDPTAELSVAGRRRPVRAILDTLDEAERRGVRTTEFILTSPATRPEDSR